MNFRMIPARRSDRSTTGGEWARVLAWVLAWVIVLGWPTAATAERQPAADTIRFTLSGAVAQALASSPRLEALAASRRAADAAARGARAAGLPSIEVAAGYTRYSNVPDFGLTIPGASHQVIAPNIPDAWRARATASLPLWTGGRIAGAAQAAQGERDAAESDLEAARADLVLETTAAYWNSRLLRGQVAVLQEALTAYGAHLDDARRRAAVGLAARNEVLAIEVERDRAELGLLQSSGAATVAEADLRRLLGLQEAVTVEPVDDLDVAVKGQAAAPPSNTIGGGREPGQGRDIDSLAVVALASRPERKAFLARVRAAEARVRVESGARWPQLATVAGLDYANPNRRLTPLQERWKQTWDASVNLQLAVFDFGRISAAVARASAQEEALRKQLEDLDRRIRLEVTARAVERSTAELAAVVAARAVESARENEKVTRDRYREGVASSSDLLDAEVQSLRAALERTDAQARLLLARANLERAAGRLP